MHTNKQFKRKRTPTINPTKSTTMKRILLKPLAIMMSMVMSFSLVSCGDDDDSGGTSGDDKTVAYYEATYSADLSDTWFDFFDVTITYTNMAGEETSELIEMNTSHVIQIPANVAPDAVNFKIHVTRKANGPAIDENQSYKFESEARLWVQSYLKDNTKSGFSSGDVLPQTQTSTIKGTNLEKFLQKYSNADFYSRSVELKK